MIMFGLILIITPLERTAVNRHAVLKVFIPYLWFLCQLGILFFGGPIIVNWLILSYSDQKLVPSNIRISPKFDIQIGRVDFVIDDAPVVGRSRIFSLCKGIVVIARHKTILDPSGWPHFLRKRFCFGYTEPKHFTIQRN